MTRPPARARRLGRRDRGRPQRPACPRPMAFASTTGDLNALRPETRIPARPATAPPGWATFPARRMRSVRCSPITTAPRRRWQECSPRCGEQGEMSSHRVGGGQHDRRRLAPDCHQDHRFPRPRRPSSTRRGPTCRLLSMRCGPDGPRACRSRRRDTHGSRTNLGRAVGHAPRHQPGIVGSRRCCPVRDRRYLHRRRRREPIKGFEPSVR